MSKSSKLQIYYFNPKTEQWEKFPCEGKHLKRHIPDEGMVSYKVPSDWSEGPVRFIPTRRLRKGDRW